MWKQLGQPKGQPSVRIAKDASGKPLHILNEIDCTVSLNGKTQQLRCYVTSNTDLNILGLDWLHAFDLWHNSINSFCNNSPELGCCTKTKISLHLKTGARPVFCPKRPVAYAILPLVDAEFKRLEQAGIISPVNYSD